VGCTLVATGSAAWTKLGCPIPKEVKRCIDKLSLFETLSDDWMDEVLAGEAVMEAIEAEKKKKIREWDKPRLVDLKSAWFKTFRRPVEKVGEGYSLFKSVS
jgi:hypothetical protein